MASELAGKQTFTIDQFPLPDNAAEGDDVELLARVEDGKLVVYGLLPSNVSNVRGVLSKLGAKNKADDLKLSEVVPELLRTIKLVTSVSDAECLAAYQPHDDHLSFTVFGPKAKAVFTAPKESGMFGSNPITLRVDQWRRITETLNPLRKHIVSISSDDTQISVEFDEQAVPDVNKWLEENGKAKQIGIGSGSSLDITVDAQTSETDELASLEWTDGVSCSKEDFELLLNFKPSKKYIAFALKDGAVKPVASDKALKDHVNLTRKSFSVVRAAIKKMQRLSPKLTAYQADGYLRLSCSYSECYQLSFVVPAV